MRETVAPLTQLSSNFIRDHPQPLNQQSIILLSLWGSHFGHEAREEGSKVQELFQDL